MPVRTGLVAAVPAVFVSFAAMAAGIAETATVLDQGEATWYGPRHAGLRTTSGAVFNPALMTAAHPSLPLGSYVRVTDNMTHRSVVVLVNDREPPHGIRCIDLSEGAARRLGMIGRGVADVTLTAASRDEVVEVAEAPDAVVTARHGRRHRHRARP